MHDLGIDTEPTLVPVGAAGLMVQRLSERGETRSRSYLLRKLQAHSRWFIDLYLAAADESDGLWSM